MDMYNFLRTAIERHIRETEPLIAQLTDEAIMQEPIPDGRPLGEVFLHMLRSIEYYLQGLVHNRWAPLPYTLVDYATADNLRTLSEKVFEKSRSYLKQLESADLSREIEGLNRPATLSQVLLELLEHSIHHRGQITVYYRLLGIEPARIRYIV
jgi:uncharacterized damage-inducible protein DinB